GIKMLVMSFNKDLAAILKKRLPEVDVIHFHKVCSQILKIREMWQSPQSIEGWLQRHAAAEMEQTGLPADYLVYEIAWRKEMEIYDDQTYLRAERKGRGQAITVEKRKVINTIFQKYLEFQESHHWTDWEDIPPMTLEALENGHSLSHYYDAILIDEAQDFAPTWIQVVKKLLKPDGYLFVCDDPTQSLFRYYSWKEKGLEIVGRTRILRTPFRCTRQINYAAYSLIANDALLRKNEEVIIPDLNSPDLLEGEKPTLVQCGTIDSEVKHIEKAIQSLLNQGIPAAQIAVLCHNRHHVKRWVHLRPKGLYVEHFEKMKGLEFTVVFVPSLHSAFDNAANEEESSIIRRKIFTAMTRARHTLMLTYQNEFPTRLEPLLKYVTQEKVR
ncbi:MAG: UvrD-helicase domain-containing protein, partial [Anaerolineae bacterium]|nr:UvrD-helicase domain-containing protein [Anaerolineae bacterium]